MMMMRNESIQQIVNCSFSNSTISGYPSFGAAATALSVVVTTALYLLVYSVGLLSCSWIVWLVHRRRQRDTIILAGLTGSGKTVLLCQLRDGLFNDETVPTTIPNEESFILYSETANWVRLTDTHNRKSNLVKLVDLPGNSKINDYNNKYLNRAAGVVFVVDATEFVWNYLTISERHLHEILTNTTMIKRKIPLLILLNKTDKLTAHTTEFIITQLQKEIEKLNGSSSEEDNAGSSSKSVFEEVLPGGWRKAFPFSSCKVSVSIAEASGFNGDVYQLQTFIRKHAKP